MARSNAVIREIRDPTDPAIAGFGRLQRSVYPDPDSLIPAEVVSLMLVQQTRQRRNLLVVAETGEQVVAGTLFHYLEEPNTGFSSFLGVAREARDQGLARRLHETRVLLLDEAAGRPVHGLFIDVVDPRRMSEAELTREERASSNPWLRRRVFQALGFRQVDVRYEQPVGGPGGGPVTVLDLLFCPREVAATVPTRVVVGTMRAYWTPWLGKAAAARHARELERRAGGRDILPLLPALADE